MPRISSNAFVAVDVETANTDPSSICSIGIVDFHNGIVKSEYSTLVNPEDVFSAQHVDIHGIDEAAVRDAPTWGRMSSRICGLLSGRVIVSHTPFDRVALTQTSARWQVVLPTCTWLDSAVLARRAWPELARSGYGLHEVCEFLSYDLKHHDALADARAAGKVLLAAMEALGISTRRLFDALTVVGRPLTTVADCASGASTTVKRDGVSDGPLAGEVVVFAGALSFVHSLAADLAAAAGCSVADTVSGKTTLLVAGEPDVRRLARHGKSAKHRKAERLIAEGVPIQILSEMDFMELLGFL